MARGYTGQMRTLSPHPVTRREWWFAAISAVAVVVVQIIGRM